VITISVVSVSAYRRRWVCEKDAMHTVTSSHQNRPERRSVLDYRVMGWRPRMADGMVL